MLLIYTGNGKGKTTAALGQAVRALGQGKRVLMTQFIKNKKVKSGEDAMTARLSKKFVFRKMGLGFVGILGDNLPISAHKKAARDALEFVAKAIKSKKYDLIILDEINVVVHLKLLKAGDVLNVLKNVSLETVVVLTGRNAPKLFIEKADLVTGMYEIKHPYQKGVTASRGLEF